ncbi:MAG: hypothetical protein SPK50_03735 [Mobiluncus porci]|uniref:hypothetical protein n=1 Tax=Mobiluncus porci TaxID=2652278 RepID=UPI0023F18C91|nr:hypothetical protein [Mobiluncus porci]MCI6584335.1 hypothetical protein [Mobiluncus sp.]MDD7540666.1 hypothetical protein [Mobiluncus porci]MDY5748229.1 hypothetical protein [Mobiluncus porci]
MFALVLAFWGFGKQGSAGLGRTFVHTPEPKQEKSEYYLSMERHARGFSEHPCHQHEPVNFQPDFARNSNKKPELDQHVMSYKPQLILG